MCGCSTIAYGYNYMFITWSTLKLNALPVFEPETAPSRRNNVIHLARQELMGKNSLSLTRINLTHVAI